MSDIDIEEYQTKANYENTMKRSIAKSWDGNQEKILITWAERASGWTWLHDKSARHYRKQTNILAYPSIILSTLAGAAGFSAAGADSTNFLRSVPYIIGLMNLSSAILASFQKFLRSTEKSESHIMYAKTFSSFTRKITLELSLHPENRKNCIEFCKICKDEYDKMVTDSPPVPTKIIDEFKETFPNEKNVPEIANGLFHFIDYVNSNDTINQNSRIIGLSD